MRTSLKENYSIEILMRKLLPVDEDASNTRFDLKEFLDGVMKKKMMIDLMDLKKINELIRAGGNLSALGKVGLTNPILKRERNPAARILVEMFHVLINAGETPEEWKGARTILKHKCDDQNDTGNWCPVTITGVIYKIIFCMIAQTLHQVNEDCDKALL